MLNGKVLYQDYFEVNPPFIIYFTQIAVVFSKLFNIDLVISLNLINFISAILSLTLCLNTINRIGNTYEKIILPTFVTYALFITPISFPTTEFGQKEHILMILLFPYIIKFILRSLPNRFEIALLCLSLMIKPFFILIYLGIAIIQLIEKQTNIFKEIPCVLLTQIVFYSWVLIIHPLYFTQIMPIALESYGALNLTDDSIVSRLYYFYIISLFTIFLYILPLIINAPFINYKMARLLPAIFASLISIFVQGKFFWYHYIPTISIIIILFGLIFVDYKTQHNKNFLKIVSLVVIFGCLLSSIPTVYNNYNNQNNIIKNSFNELFDFLSNYKNQRILILSPHISPAFPIINYLNLKWDMKEHSMQILDGIFKYPDLLSHKSYSLKYVIDDVTQALSKKPKIVIISKPLYNEMNNKWILFFFFKADQNYVSFFSKNIDFKLLWQNYRLKSEIGNNFRMYEIYERI